MVSVLLDFDSKAKEQRNPNILEYCMHIVYTIHIHKSSKYIILDIIFIHAHILLLLDRSSNTRLT